jgi:hypothetical protein
MLAGFCALVVAVATFLIHRDEAEAIAVWNQYAARALPAARAPTPIAVPKLQPARPDAFCELPVRLREDASALFLIAAEGKRECDLELLCWPEENDQEDRFSVR